MKKNNKILTAALIMLFLTIVFVGRTTVVKYKENKLKEPETVRTAVSEETSANKKESAKPLKERQLNRLAEYMSSVGGITVTPEILGSYSQEKLSSLYEYCDSETLCAANWREATGYTLNAFADKFITYESKDMGNNDRDYFEIGFTGDINFTEGSYVMPHARQKKNCVLDCISDTFQAEMKKVDIMLINNEFPYSDRGSPRPGKKYTFRAKPESVEYLTEMGVDIVSLANNHAYDYGYDAFTDTLQTLKDAGLPYVGAGMNFEEASKPVTFLINGYKIAFLACSGVDNEFTPVAQEDSPGTMGSYDDGISMSGAIAKAKQVSDYVIVYPHWGWENTTELTPAQKSNARKFIDSGADAVVGNHSHILQGMEFYKGIPIFYSLGNFWFNTRNQYTGLLKIRFYPDRTEPVFVPGRQEYSETHYIEDSAKQRELFNLLEGWSSGKVTISDDGIISEKK